MTLGSLAAGGFPAGSLITPSVMSPLVLTGMQCGFLSSLALIVPMLLSTCSKGADPIGPWAVDSTCCEEQVVCRRAVGAGPSVWGTCSEGAGVRSVHVVHGFP